MGFGQRWLADAVIAVFWVGGGEEESNGFQFEMDKSSKVKSGRCGVRSKGVD